MNTENLSTPIDILLVEDNPGDARLALESLKESKIRNTLHWVQDGLEAMKFLYRQGSYENAPRADLILLDLNMPKMDGREVLAEIKSDDELKRIPVVIFTISKAEEDILKAYDLHTNCYITKPLDLDRFLKVIQSIEDFWLTIVRLPKG
jgi:two-component system, chemotaxis family, response regulator Rcp1